MADEKKEIPLKKVITVGDLYTMSGGEGTQIIFT
jgi:hypothetical protein